MNKIIIGITGHSGSGKGTVAQYIHNNHGAEYIKYSDVFRGVLDQLELPQSRENIDFISKTLRDAYGQNVAGEIVQRKIQNSTKNLFVIEAIRRPAEIQDITQYGHFVLLFVDVPMDVRYERVVMRSQNPGDATKTFEEFQADQKDDAQIRIDALREKADYVLENTGDITALQEKIAALINEVLI